MMQAESQTIIDRNYPALQLSLHYCDPSDKARILAMYGLLATVEETLHRASDPVVSRAKLGWWLEELNSARSAGERHPLTKELQDTGVLSAWPEALITRLFTLAMSRTEAQVLNNEESLKELCKSIGLVQLDMESALHDLPLPDHDLAQQWATTNGFIQLLGESFKAKKPSYFWLPLTLCAQFGVARYQLANKPSAELSGRLFAYIIDVVMNWSSHAELKVEQLQELPKTWVSINRHWLILSSLQQRQLRRLRLEFTKRSLKVEDFKALQRTHLGDAWHAWRLARQLSRVSRG